MKNLAKLFLITLLFFSTKSVAQCPIASFSLPDTACGGDSISIQNNSLGSNLKYEWDFNANDMALSPSGSSLGTYPGLINSSLGIDITQAAGSFHGLIMSLSGGLTHLDFGSSINNPPVPTSLGNLAGISNPVDISIVEEGGSFYALVNTLGGRVYRLEFGNSLSNTPTTTQINVSPSLFNNAYYHTVCRTSTGLFMLVSNYGGGTVTVIDFGGTIMNNNPTAGNIVVPGANPISIAIGFECGQYYGFVGYASNSKISRIEFGPFISSSPIQVTNLGTSVQTSYREITLINDGYNWFLTAASFAGDLLQSFSFGPSLANLSPSLKSYPGLSAFSSGSYAYCIKKTGSIIKGFSTNYSTGQLSSFLFPESNTGAPPPINSSSPIINFSGNGYYHLNLTVTDSLSGFASRFRDSIYIRSSPNADFSFPTPCSGTYIDFTNLANSSEGIITNYNWSFGNGFSSNLSDPSVLYTTSGPYNVTLEVITNYGCQDSITKPLEVFEPPQANFTFTDDQCMGVSVQLTDLSTISSGSISEWYWDFGNGESSTTQNPSNSWETEGTSTITLVVTSDNGCKDSILNSISILPGPIVDFSVTNTCLGDTVNFLNTTTAPGSVSPQYLWYLGDSTTSAEINPLHTYSTNSPADFEVTLIATGNNNCNDTLIKTIHVGNPATANFTLSADSICIGSPLLLTNVSLIPPGESESSNIWDFGNGNSDYNTASTQAIYQDPGNYLISLTVQTNTSCLSSIQKPVVVIDRPKAQFTANDACIGTPVLFTNNSTTPAGTQVTAWSWDFGDSTLSNLENPVHLYAFADSFLVRLFITHNLGCTDSLEMPVVIHERPTASFIPSKACSNQPVYFTDSSMVGDGYISQWSWDFGDGSPADTNYSPSHIFNQSAAYTINLTATSNHGCSDTVTTLILVDQSPLFLLNSSYACKGTLTEYDINFLQSPPILAGYLWDFGDSTSSTQPLPLHLYSLPGTYITSLTVSDLDNGCSSSQTVNSIVHENPEAGFSYQNVCSGTPFIPTDSSISDSSVITTWEWDAEGYGTYSGKNIQIVCNTADTFDLKLVVTTDNGCKDSITHTLVSYPKPIVSFETDVTLGSPPLTVNYMNSSSDDQYFWNFGDGNSFSGQAAIMHTFIDTGVYNTVLTAISANGCIDSSSLNIYVITPVTDLAIKGVSYYLNNNQWMMEIQIQNLGNQIVKSAEFKISLQHQNPIIELKSALNLLPGESKWITLDTRYQADGMKKPDLFCAEIIKANDELDIYEDNNKECKSLNNSLTFYPAYPNPGRGIFNLAINSDKEREISITLFNSIGQVLNSPIGISVQEGYKTFEYSIENYPSGIYFITLESEKVKENIRLVKY